MIHLKIKEVITDRFTVLQVLYPNQYETPSGDDVIALSQVSNANQDIAGTPLWQLARKHAKLDKSYLLKTAPDTYVIDFRLSVVKKSMKKRLNRYVHNAVSGAMEPLKWFRYFEFYRLHEKGTLTTAEQYIYDIELNGKSEAVVWAHVSQKIKWYYDCIAKLNQYNAIIDNETNMKTLVEMNLKQINLPEWEVGG